MSHSNTLAIDHVAGFIETIFPFDQLQSDTLFKLVKKLKIDYQIKQQDIPIDPTTPEIFIIKKGAMLSLDEHGKTHQQYTEAEACLELWPDNDFQPNKLTVLEDCLFYRLPVQAIETLLADKPKQLSLFAHVANFSLPQTNAEEYETSGSLNIAQKVELCYSRPAVVISPDSSIHQAAQLMTEKNLSSLLITKDDNLIGIVTDKDLRRRCLAAELNPQTAVKSIMTKELTTTTADTSCFDALMTMTKLNIHHLPVVDNKKALGILTLSDLMRLESHNSVNLIRNIQNSRSLEELTELCHQLPTLQMQLSKLNPSALELGKTFTAITQAITCQLIKFIEVKLGPAPVPYAWIALGSQARAEQTAHSDQDNALILHDSYQPEHDAYFRALSQYVCDGLNACGFVYCPGEIMATTDKWRQPLATWRKYFRSWIEQPDPKALLNVSVFFDLHTVCGDSSLVTQLQEEYLTLTQRQSLFIAQLSRAALQLKPPLGFFRDFVLVNDGNNHKALDLKHHGLAPIIDLARIYALACGVEHSNTVSRIDACAGSHILTEKSAKNLKHAYEFVANLRLKVQNQQRTNHQPVSNFVHPRELSQLERQHLKSAFKLIKQLQDSRQVTY